MSNDRITRTEARVLAAAEFKKFAALAASLTPDEWATDTDCVGWDVRKTILHVLGSADAQASPRVFLHQLRRGLPLNKQIESHHWVDGLNELQIRERSGLTDAQVVAQIQGVGAKAVRGRFGTPPADALPTGPVRRADRLEAGELPARGRLHPRRVGASDRHPRRHRPSRGAGSSP